MIDVEGGEDSRPRDERPDSGELLDLGELDLNDLASVSNPILSRSLARLIDEAGGSRETGAGFNSAI